MTVEEFTRVLRMRQSVRSFSPRPVGEDALGRIMEAGRLAASAANRQPWKFFLLHREGREEFDLLLRPSFRAAPAIIVACARPDKAWVRKEDGKNYGWVDVSIAVTEMVLAATAEGLGTCWIAAFDPGAARRILGLDDTWEPVTAVALGEPEKPLDMPVKKRKSFDEVWEVR